MQKINFKYTNSLNLMSIINFRDYQIDENKREGVIAATILKIQEKKKISQKKLALVK